MLSIPMALLACAGSVIGINVPDRPKVTVVSDECRRRCIGRWTRKDDEPKPTPFPTLDTMNRAPHHMMALSLAGIDASLHMLKETPKAFHELNFKWRNQRQLRKKRRRAAAAGKKNVFKKSLRGKTR